MTSTQVPPVDLAPGMPSRVVTISATDVTEGGQSMAGQMVRFALSDTLDVSSGGDVIAKTQAEVVLDSNGEGRIRLPVYDENVKTWCGQDWAILVTATWGSQKAIRVPAGTSSIALSALPSVRPLRGREKQWAVIGASVSVTEGAQWDASVSLSGGVLDFDFTVPPGATAYWRGATPLTTDADLTALESGRYTVWSVEGAESLGLPTPTQGVLEVARWGANGRLQTWSARDGVDPAPQIWQRHYLASAWSPWTRVDAGASTWWHGGVTTNDPAVLNGLDTAPGVRTVWSDEAAETAGLPTVTQGVLEHFRYGNSGAIQRWTSRPPSDPPEIWVRQSTPTGDGWLPWARVGAGASGGAGGSGFKTIPLAVTLGNNGSVNAATSGIVRYALHFNAPVSRWRLHVANRNARSGASRSGTVTFGAWQLGAEGAAGAITAPATVLDGFTTDGTGWVSPWVSAPIGTDEPLLLGTTYSSAVAPIAQVGAAWTGASEGNLTRATLAPFEVWIEAETPATTPVVAVLGSSSDTGVGGTRPVVDSTIARWARAHGALPVHYAHSGDAMSSSMDRSAYKWTRWAHLDRPDSVLFALGSNDVHIGGTLAEWQARHAAVVKIAADMISPVQYGSTIYRRANGEVTGRTEYNTWLQGQPNGLREVFDFSAAIGSPPNPAFDADGIHVNDAGHSAILATITSPLTGPAPVAEPDWSAAITALNTAAA